jgi:pyrroloquinoline quinone biosynthesis protein B
MLRAVVLGAAAGGGFPQWNSNTLACRRARRGEPGARARTQASLAVSANERDWFVLNASPDLRLQIEANPVLHPREGLRSSPVSGVVLTGADVDAVAGLLHLRERHKFNIYAPDRVLSVLTANPIFGVLAPDFVQRFELGFEQRTELLGSNCFSGVAVVAFPVPAKVPLYLETAGEVPLITEEGDAVGLEIIDPEDEKSFFFIPGCAAMTDRLRRRLAGSELVFFDGTLWRDDEMIKLGVGTKTGLRMGHMSMSGVDGTIAAFRDLDVQRRIFIHINNSNPVLLDDSEERRIAEAAGWEVAYDGMEVNL